MMCLVRLKNINILLLAVLLLWSCMCAVCGATEKTYTITESQLTQLETNLTELKEQNKTLQEQLQTSKTQVQELQQQSETLQAQSMQLQTQVANLTQSLNNAQTLLTKYEANQQKNKSYTIGVGGGSNGLGLYASKDKTWMYLDKDTATIGWQIKF